MIHPLSRLALIDPARVERKLERIRHARVVPPEQVPNLWQVTLGVARMWHRLVFRPETVGTCRDFPVRRTWRARLLQFRPLRFPFLMAERAVAPWDMTGLLSGADRISAHLLGAHHDRNQAIYDIQILAAVGVPLEPLRARAQAIVDGRDPRATWWRDLVVFDAYHETLVDILDRAMRGEDGLSAAEAADPDVSFLAYLRWCAAQPATPGATWEALRAGAYDLGRGLTANLAVAPC